jgi:Putative peptidoglycan binding domain
MKRGLLICIGIVAVALTADARMPYNPAHRNTPQKKSTYAAYRGTSAVRQTAPQRTFSNARVRQPAVSSARFREPAFRQLRMQPRMSSSFRNRPATTDIAARRQTRAAFTNDLPGSRFSPRPNSTFVNRSARSDVVASRQQRLGAANDSRQSRLRERPRPSSSLLNPFTMNDTAARRPRRAEFNDRLATTYFKGQTRSSFVNRSGATTAAIQGQRRAAFSNNWRGEWFAGRQYSAFRNYQSQWHDSGWWYHHCDRIVFVTVYSEPFPFYFDAGYWYPAWGYYADAYYPYDGPIYCYNDLPPDEIITNVQIQLYDEGYYDGPIDGILGPDTRVAIADYQTDHGLAVTAAIDEPTVESLGLV